MIACRRASCFREPQTFSTGQQSEEAQTEVSHRVSALAGERYEAARLHRQMAGGRHWPLPGRPISSSRPLALSAVEPITEFAAAVLWQRGGDRAASLSLALASSLAVVPTSFRLRRPFGVRRGRTPDGGDEHRREGDTTTSTSKATTRGEAKAEGDLSPERRRGGLRSERGGLWPVSRCGVTAVTRGPRAGSELSGLHLTSPVLGSDVELLLARALLRT